MSNLAETILRDVPIRGRIYTGGNCLDELVFKKDVEAALTAAMDPAIAERDEALASASRADQAAKADYAARVAAEAQIAALTARVEGLTGLLCLADEALMKSHGCFPIDRTNERQIFLNDACTAIRKATGDDYAERKRRARAALSTTEASHE